VNYLNPYAMKTSYICPHCRGIISPGNNIILSAKAPNNKRGLILLHEEIGNYSSIKSDSIEIKEGEVVDFFCPICHESLNFKENFAKYKKIDSDLKESWIIISRIYGERITFKIDDNMHIDTYGEKLNRFVDPEWFLKM